MNTEMLFNVVLLPEDKITVTRHADGEISGHITGVFLSHKEALANARKISRQHDLVLITDQPLS